MSTQHGLFRSRTDKVFGGVCGGIAKSLNTDPFIIRLVFALLFIFAGSGILLYIILWIALPEEPITFYSETNPMPEGDQPGPTETQAGPTEPFPVPQKRNNGTLIVGLVLICMGIVFLADRLMPGINFRDFWPVIIIVAGLALIAGSFSTFKKS